MHIAFVGLPLYGHINPTLEVVRELVRQGHRVSYPTTAQRSALIAETSAEVFTIQSSFAGSGQPTDLPGRDDWMTHMRLAMLDEAEMVLPQLLAHFDGDQPDLVLHDRAAFAGRVFAAIQRIKTIQLVPSFAANAHWAVSHKFAPIDPTSVAGRLFESRLLAFLASYRFTRQDMPALGRQIVFLPKAFQYRGETFDDKYHFVGPCLRPAASTWAPPPDRERVLLISMGTINNDLIGFYRLCMRTFADTSWHVVMAVGGSVDIAGLGPIPPNFEVTPFAPQLEVLRHASAFVGHGGMGGIMEALHFGVPLLLLPQTPEQEANALRVAELDLGVVLGPDISSSALHTMVEKTASDPAIADRLAWMRREVNSAGGASRAAAVITSAL